MFKLLEKICQILDNMRIPYMLSGSVAMNLYAEPRTTQDIDLVVEMLTKRYLFLQKPWAIISILQKKAFMKKWKEKGCSILLILKVATKLILSYERTKFMSKSSSKDV